MTALPAVFLGHGNPMNTLDDNEYTRLWAAVGAKVPTPRAIVCISAHWYMNHTAVTAMPQPRTIHDFYGFPDELFAFQYPAPGSAEVAAEVAEIAKPTWVGLDTDQWGFDHGAWSVLAHAYPEANIPVVQLSIDAGQPVEYHVNLGAKLAGLRERNIFVVASGNIVHNLGMINFGLGDQGFDWAHRYDDAVREVLTTDPGSFGRLVEHPDHRRAVPAPDHWLPMAYVAGMAAAADQPLSVLIDGYFGGSLSMTSYGLAL